MALAKVAGIADLYGYAYCDKQDWDEIAPVSIKKKVTGNAKASKEDVAASLEKYVGK